MHEHGNDMHPADPRVRRQALVALLGAAIFGGLGLWWLASWLERLPLADPATLRALLWSSVAATLFVCAVALVAAATLWRIGANADREGRFPPAGLRTARDVPIRRGPAAARSAVLCRAGAGAAVLVALAVLAWMGWALGTMH